MLTTNQMALSTPINLPHPRTIRALILDDSRFDRARIRRLTNAIQLSISLDEVGSIIEMEKAVESEDYDLIFVDYTLPVGDGMVALDYIHDCPRNRNAGKIMVTGSEAMGTVVEAMRAGCHDFLCKDQIDIESLRSAILNVLKIAQQGATGSLSAGDSYQQFTRARILDALDDTEVRSRLVSVMREAVPAPDDPDLEQKAHLEALLATLSEADDFVFH